MQNGKTQMCIVIILSLFAMQGMAQSLKSLMQRPFNIIESNWERNSKEDLQLVYTNNDYCDYYVYRIDDRSYNLRPGKNTMFTIPKGSNVDNPFKEPSSFMYFRGNFVKDFDIKFPYALPVKNGKVTAWKTDLRESVKTLNFYMHRGDTVYATRSGIACKTTNPRQLLIYHADHTFAAYLVMDENFIVPGEQVLTGQPVGIAGKTCVSITYFFLDENKFDALQATGYAYSHFMPTFRTTEGDVIMEEKKKYEAVTDDDLIMRDMSKREQKKYLKKKNKNK
ncbi:M23 family peptidase [Bacteroides caecigallinarum]|uniref:M23 family peptidase n=1 Tax=Bacteroides caecigallinarum TaxID=1411144 RepID=UPI001959351D|nr:M23 family peptidase [Bacteroides caecigallinarum]MBM6865441.1 M23 family peptidase [Bacteroides caecigallinarum]MBU3807283.1 M23 family metallopeptidase [Candidatus Phocaeicola faecipullorum]